ncbi:MAG TPA: glucose 1-dehydrogenase [Pyrinomonadaceae bacterium]|jgi:NAD(P)-dependent dehydrogenase (short-subunit alcohol dehydrogenase family)
MFDLSGKIALVTGAASGIGEAIAGTLQRAGAFVYVADLDETNGNRVAGELENAKFIKIDVAESEDCRKAAKQVLEEKGRLDILVNNAGLGHVGTLLETSEEDLERLFAVNVRGMFSLTKAFLPSMIEHKYGVIINLASIGGVIGIRDRLAYCTTKFAVVGLTKCVALDHAAQGIRANAICPGRVETPFVKKRLAEYPDPEKAFQEMAATQALGRMGRPEEIAAAALYLASDEAAFVTGTAFEIDGGWAAGK